MVSIFDVKITTKWEVENNISLYLRNILKSWQLLHQFRIILEIWKTEHIISYQHQVIVRLFV